MSGMRMTLEQLRPEHQEQVKRQLAEARNRKGKGKLVPAERKHKGPGKKIPPKNTTVDLLEYQLRVEKLWGWVAEHRFHPTRGWRMDFANPAAMLAIEIEGLTFEGGRHQRFKGFTEDCKKYFEAMMLGWRVIRVTPAMVRHGFAIDYIKRALNMPQGESCSQQPLR